MAAYVKEYKTSVYNSTLSLQRPISIPRLCDQLQDYPVVDQVSHFLEYPKLYMWDFGKLMSKILNVGDTTFVLTSDNLYYGDVLEIIPDKRGVIGDVIGWKRQYRNPWQNVAIFKEIREAKPTIEIRQSLLKGVQKAKNCYLVDETEVLALI